MLRDQVAVKALKPSYYNEEILLFSMYPCGGNLIQVPYQQPRKGSKECKVPRIILSRHPARESPLLHPKYTSSKILHFKPICK